MYYDFHAYTQVFQAPSIRGLVYIVWKGDLTDMITFMIQTHKTIQFRLTVQETTRTRRSARGLLESER